MRFLRGSLILLSLTFSAFGCKGNCRELSEKLCRCEPNSLAREACENRASREEDRLSPTDEQEAVCESLLDKCDCTQIATVEGRQACGLTR